LRELADKYGNYKEQDAAAHYHQAVLGQSIDYVEEHGHYDRKRIHNLKYYTWIEQQGKELEELNAQWYDYQNYWREIHKMGDKIDRLIQEFNARTGLVDQL